MLEFTFVVLQFAEAVLDSHEAFIESSKPVVGEVDVPLSVVDFFQSDVLSDQHAADVDPLLAPPDTSVGADIASLEAVGVLRSQQLAWHLPR